MSNSVGVVVPLWGTAQQTIDFVRQADTAGVPQVWMPQPATTADALTVLAVAARETRAIRLGTSIVPTYPRHPGIVAQQALALSELAPRRLRLGVGPSHRAVIEGCYGIRMHAPLTHLREYLTVLRGLLWEGTVEYHGRFYDVSLELSHATQTPLLISALSPAAYRLAGEMADGALAWLCPTKYLLDVAVPSVRHAADAAERQPPPVVAHVPVALSNDRASVLAAMRRQFGSSGASPFYAQMFARAGFPPVRGQMSDELLAELVVAGEPDQVAERLSSLRELGFEVMAMLVAVEESADETSALLAVLATLAARPN